MHNIAALLARISGTKKPAQPGVDCYIVMSLIVRTKPRNKNTIKYILGLMITLQAVKLVSSFVKFFVRLAHFQLFDLQR